MAHLRDPQDAAWRLLRGTVQTLLSHAQAWCFNEPVDEAKHNAPGYYTVVKDPQDLQTILKRLNSRTYYSSPEDVARALETMFSNAELYNGPDHAVSQSARVLRRMWDKAWTKVQEHWLGVSGTGRNRPQRLNSAPQPLGDSDGRPATQQQVTTGVKRTLSAPRALPPARKQALPPVAPNLRPRSQPAAASKPLAPAGRMTAQSILQLPLATLRSNPDLRLLRSLLRASTWLDERFVTCFGMTARLLGGKTSHPLFMMVQCLCSSCILRARPCVLPMTHFYLKARAAVEAAAAGAAGGSGGGMQQAAAHPQLPADDEAAKTVFGAMHFNNAADGVKVPFVSAMQCSAEALGGSALLQRRVWVYQYAEFLPAPHDEYGSWQPATVTSYEPATGEYEVTYDEAGLGPEPVLLAACFLHWGDEAPAPGAAPTRLPIVNLPSLTGSSGSLHLLIEASSTLAARPGGSTGGGAPPPCAAAGEQQAPAAPAAAEGGQQLELPANLDVEAAKLQALLERPGGHGGAGDGAAEGWAAAARPGGSAAAAAAHEVDAPVAYTHAVMAVAAKLQPAHEAYPGLQRLSAPLTRYYHDARDDSMDKLARVQAALLQLPQAMQQEYQRCADHERRSALLRHAVHAIRDDPALELRVVTLAERLKRDTYLRILGEWEQRQAALHQQQHALARAAQHGVPAEVSFCPPPWMPAPGLEQPLEVRASHGSAVDAAMQRQRRTSHDSSSQAGLPHSASAPLPGARHAPAPQHQQAYGRYHAAQHGNAQPPSGYAAMQHRPHAAGHAPAPYPASHVPPPQPSPPKLPPGVHTVSSSGSGRGSPGSASARRLSMQPQPPGHHSQAPHQQAQQQQTAGVAFTRQGSASLSASQEGSQTAQGAVAGGSQQQQRPPPRSSGSGGWRLVAGAPAGARASPAPGAVQAPTPPQLQQSQRSQQQQQDSFGGEALACAAGESADEEQRSAQRIKQDPEANGMEHQQRRSAGAAPSQQQPYHHNHVGSGSVAPAASPSAATASRGEPPPPSQQQHSVGQGVPAADGAATAPHMRPGTAVAAATSGCSSQVLPALTDQRSASGAAAGASSFMDPLQADSLPLPAITEAVNRLLQEAATPAADARAVRGALRRLVMAGREGAVRCVYVQLCDAYMRRDMDEVREILDDMREQQQHAPSKVD